MNHHSNSTIATRSTNSEQERPAVSSPGLFLFLFLFHPNSVAVAQLKPWRDSVMGTQSTLPVEGIGVKINSLHMVDRGMSSTAETDGTIDVTEIAADQALDLLDGEDMDTNEAGLRLFVRQGGCAGLSYGMRFDHGPEEDDTVYEHKGLRVFVDPASMDYIEGSVLDFEGGLQGAGFHVENPNVVSECGCGESFRT